MLFLSSSSSSFPSGVSRIFSLSLFGIFPVVVSTLLNFVRMFARAHEENCKQLEFEKKKAQKEAQNEKMKAGTVPKKELLIQTPIKSGNIKS